MGSAINAELPYDDMSGNLYTLARFYECGSYGPGYAVNAERRQISPAAAETLLASLGWNPETALEEVGGAYVGEVIVPGPGESESEETFPEEPPAEDPALGESGDEKPDDSQRPVSQNQDGGKEEAGLDNENTEKSGALITDEKSKSVYKISAEDNSDYTVTYMRPSSEKVTSVKVPATVSVNGVDYKVTSIAANAFKGQKKLKKVIIGSNVKKIGKKAFKGCKKLEKIVIKSKKLKKVGAKAFAAINKNAKVKVPKGKFKTYRKIFKKKTGIKRNML